MQRKLQYPVTTILIAANIIVFVMVEIFGGSTLETQVLLDWGGAYQPYISAGQYWRLFTCMFLHSGIQHLTNNMLTLGVLGTALEPQLGAVRYTILYVLGGLAGSWAANMWYAEHDPYVVSVGASGAIFAVMGGLLWVVIRNRGRVEQMTLRQMLIMLAFSIYFSFSMASVSWPAHIGGLIAGFICAILLYRKKTW